MAFTMTDMTRAYEADVISLEEDQRSCLVCALVPKDGRPEDGMWFRFADEEDETMEADAYILEHTLKGTLMEISKAIESLQASEQRHAAEIISTAL